MTAPTPFSDRVAFHPWVGDRYHANSPRMLVIGESHYGAALSDSDVTTEGRDVPSSCCPALGLQTHAPRNRVPCVVLNCCQKLRWSYAMKHMF